jgi:peptide/nickel transport system permease protein
MSVTLLLVTLITFGFTNVLPGDVALVILGPNADEASLQALRAQLGLNRPLYVQYFDWVTDLLRGDLGTSLRFDEPVAALISERLPRSLLLAGAATLFAILLAIPLGVISAVNENRWPDYLASTIAFAGLSVPGFFWGILFIFLFAVQFQLLPSGGFVPISEDPIAALRHLLMPAVALGFALTAYIMRMTRSSMVEVLREEYVALAEAKGLSERTVVLKHALRNAVIPVITVIAFQFSYAFGGVVVIEEVFYWPGIGQLTLSAIENRDIPLIQGTVIVVALVFMFSNLVADILYAYFDPRIRYDGEA